VKKTFLIVAALVSFTAFAFAGGDQNQNQYDGEKGQGPTYQYRIDTPNKDTLQVRQITEEQKAIIYGIYEEEKVARDVYITLGKIYTEENTFANIQLAEQTHMDAVRKLCVKYGIEIPEPDKDVSLFDLPEMEELYWYYVGQGELSLLDALKAGQDIEIMDIADLKAASEGMPRDVQNVFNNLMIGSTYHLEAFTNAITREESLND
jgi:hypothetical protein